MCSRQSLSRPLADAKGLPQSGRNAAIELVLKRRALHKLHHKVGRPVILIERVNGDDVTQGGALITNIKVEHVIADKG